MEHDLFHIVFCVVLLSISIQGTLLPWFARKTNMINRAETYLPPLQIILMKQISSLSAYL